MRLLHGDCLDILRSEKNNSVDSIVCDPPYGINILDSDWDKHIPELKIWKECHRVLRPGGHILAFSSARLYHHQAILMERAGFETFNMLSWVYGSGMPKGKNLSREFDRSVDIPKPDDNFRDYLRSAIKKSPYKIVELERMCGTKGIFSHYLGKSQPIYPSHEVWSILKNVLDLDETYDDLFIELKKKRDSYKKGKKIKRNKNYSFYSEPTPTYYPKTDLAKKWHGWRYGKQSLRPSFEPIYFGQKPPLRPLRRNIETWGIGALNIDGCRETESDGVTREMSSCLVGNSSGVCNNKIGKTLTQVSDDHIFCVNKPNLKERRNNPHPTVKPIALMQKLVRLVTPKGGICLDPFMGSGTTGLACQLEDVQFFGIEKEKEYFDIAVNRIQIQKSA